MGIISSLLYRLIKQEPLPTEAYPTIKKQFYYSEIPTSLRLRQHKLEIATATNNRISYGEQSYVILRADHSFDGEMENTNLITLSFDLEGEKNIDLELFLSVPLTSNQILPGSYKYSEEDKENSLEGLLSVDWKDEEEQEHEEEIDITWGKVNIQNIGNGNYHVSGDCICEDKKKLTIHYEGPFYFSNDNPEPNGKGYFLYQGKEYSLTTAFECYEGIESEYVSDANSLFDLFLHRWSDHIHINFEVDGETEEYFYQLNVYFSQPEGKQILAGIYPCTPNKLFPLVHMPMNSCTVIVSIMPNEDKEENEKEKKEKHTFVLMEGSVEVIRDETLTIKGEGQLDNGEPFSFYYKGVPEWSDMAY